MCSTLSLLGWEILYDSAKPHIVGMTRTIDGRGVCVAVNVLEDQLAFCELAVNKGKMDSDPGWPVPPILRDLYAYREYAGIGAGTQALVFTEALDYQGVIQFAP